MQIILAFFLFFVLYLICYLIFYFLGTPQSFEYRKVEVVLDGEKYNIYYYVSDEFCISDGANRHEKNVAYYLKDDDTINSEFLVVSVSVTFFNGRYPTQQRYNYPNAITRAGEKSILRKLIEMPKRKDRQKMFGIIISQIENDRLDSRINCPYKVK